MSQITNNLHDYLIVGLLFLINLLNHVDRLIIAGTFISFQIQNLNQYLIIMILNK